MKFKILDKLFCKKSGLAIVEILAVLFVFTVIAGSFAAWRLLSEPVNVDFLKPYIQEAVRDSGFNSRIGEIVLYWPDLREPLLVGLQDAEIYETNGRLIASVEEAAIDLNKLQLLLGRIRPETLIIKRPNLSVTRNADNSFDIGIPDFERYGPPRPKSSSSMDEKGIRDIARSIINDDLNILPILSKLRRFEIEDAGVLIDDRVLSFSWILPKSNLAIIREGVRFRAFAEIEFPNHGENQTPAMFDADVEVMPDHIAIEADLDGFEVSQIADKIPDMDVLAAQNVNIDVDFNARIDASLAVEQARLVVSSASGAVNIDALSPDPVTYSNLALDAEYSDEAGSIILKDSQITTGDVTLQFGAELVRGDGGEFKGPVRVDIASMAHSAIAPLWPVVLADDNSRVWIVENLSAGTFSDAYAQADLRLSKLDGLGWSVGGTNVVAGFAFEEMSIAYHDTLQPVTNAKGQGTFDLANDKLHIDVESGKALDMDVADGVLEFADLTKTGAGTADINFKLAGSVASALRFIKDEPISADTGVDIPNALGQVALDIGLKFPTVKDVEFEEFKVDISGQMRDVRLPNILRGMALSGGPYDISVKDNMLKVSGEGTLEDQPARISHEEFLDSAGKAYRSRTTASMPVTDAMREKFGMDLTDFLTGAPFVDVIYTEIDERRAEARVKADLTGANVFLEPFKYDKPIGDIGNLSVKANLRDGSLMSLEGLNAQANGLSIENARLNFRQVGGEDELSSGTFPRFTVGETIGDAKFEIAQNETLKLEIKGPFFDLRPFLESEKRDPNTPRDTPPIQVSIAADAMRTADEAVVQYGKIYLDMDGEGAFNQLEMDARVGKGTIYLRYKPDETGERVFRLEADDAGAALKAFDLYDGMKGGTLMVFGAPKRGFLDRNLVGSAKISNFSVVDAPALVRLLGAMSIKGANEGVSGQGVVFTKFEADFDWLYRPEGSALVFKNGRTRGNSLGLTFEGTVDNASDTIDAKGTIIPLSGVNRMIGNIPVVGDILTGGTGSLIAATYTIKGESSDPKVAVNPLSVLTPGILRRILFEN